MVSVKKSGVSFLGLQLTFPSKINLLSGVPDAWDRWVKCVIIILNFVSSLKIQSSLSDSSHYGKKKLCFLSETTSKQILGKLLLCKCVSIWISLLCCGVVLGTAAAVVHQ